MTNKVSENGDGMKTLIRFVLFLTLTIVVSFGLTGSQSASAQEKVAWRSDPQQAAVQAASENKLVLLHFTAQWCGPCQTQQRFVFSNPTVAQAVNQHVIPVLVDIDINRQLAGELGVKSIPFDVFLTPGGEVVTKRSSPTDSRNFIQMVKATRMPGTAPKSGALAKLAELKRRFDPMNLPSDQRGNFEAEGPGVATVGVSKEAMELGAKSNYGDQMSFQKRNSKGTPQSGVNSDLQAVFSQLAQRRRMKERSPDSSSSFFEIPTERSSDRGIVSAASSNQIKTDSNLPDANANTQRSYENMERQAFLARRRSEIQIPNQPTDVQPVRVMNKSFFATQKNFGVGSLRASKNIPGVEISEMVDARTGKSIARIKSENSQPQPFNKARIVPRRENRIAGHAASDSFASQATHKRETSQATTKLILDDVDNAQPKLAEGSMTTVKPETNESQATAGPSEFCLQGKCPVTLSLQGKWVDGDSRWGIVHRDRTYLFSSEDNYRRFKKEPDLYSPVLAAYDPVTLHDSGTFVDGLEVNGVFMEKDGHQQIVLFSSAANREKFQAHPQRYMKSVRAAIEVASQTNGLSEDADTKVR